jgi:hypothetical protein
MAAGWRDELVIEDCRMTIAGIDCARGEWPVVTSELCCKELQGWLTPNRAARE